MVLESTNLHGVVGQNFVTGFISLLSSPNYEVEKKMAALLMAHPIRPTFEYRFEGAADGRSLKMQRT